MSRRADSNSAPAPDPAGSDIPPNVKLFQPRADGGEPRLDEPVERAMGLLPATGRLTILVNDPQRHTASAGVLKQVVRRIAPGRARVLIAAGSHDTPLDARPAFERDLLGKTPFAGVAWHDSRSDRLVPIGPRQSWRGHPWLLDCDGLLAVGSVEPHYFAGFTGAHKTATVGVAAYGDIQANHARALEPRCRPGCLEGNPVAEGVLAMLSELEAVRPVAAVNLVQAGAGVVAAVGGGPADALHAAVPHAKRAFLRHLPGPADAVVAEVTGPLSESFYQADKGIKNNEWAVRDGGLVVLAAPCPRGIGQDRFVALLREAATYRQALDVVARRGYRLGDHKAVLLRRLTDPAARAVKVVVVSEGISARDAQVLGLAKADGVPAALAACDVHPGADVVCWLRDAGNLALLAGGAPGRRN